MRGKELSTERRQQLYRLFAQGKSIAEVHDIVFDGDILEMSKGSLYNLFTKFKRQPAATDHYILGPMRSHLGQKRKMDEDAMRYFMQCNAMQ